MDNFAWMKQPGRDRFAGASCPDAGGVVGAACRQVAITWADDDERYLAAMFQRQADRFARSAIPDARRAIGARGYDELIVARKRDTGDWPRMRQGQRLV